MTLLFLWVFALSCTHYASRDIAHEDSFSIIEQRSAFEVWAELQESAVQYNARAVLVDGHLDLKPKT